MKHLLFLLGLSLTVCFSVEAQDADHNAFYDYSETQLSNTDTIPGYSSNENKIKVSGTIYLDDGVTPAKDVILYIEQADEHGDFDVRKIDDKKYVHNRGWVKTDADGKYTFYTFIPGNDRIYNQLQQLYPIVKEPSKDEYKITSFLFDDDPMLSKHCRKRMAKKGDPSRILKPTKTEDGLLVAQKDIILHEGILTTQ